MKNAPAKETGFTLIELIITVTIIAVIAAIAMPAFSSGSDKKLDTAAAEFASAIRYARTESIRTGTPYGFHSQPNENQIRVFRLDDTTNPATLIYDVYHPIDKSLYDIDLDLQSLASADLLDQTTSYPVTCNRKNRIYFDSNGMPWCSDPTAVRLDNFELFLYKGTAQKLVTLDRITGRVTVQ